MTDDSPAPIRLSLHDARAQIVDDITQARLRAAEAAHAEAMEALRRAEAREQTDSDLDRVIERKELYATVVETTEAVHAAQAAVDHEFCDHMAVAGTWKAAGRRGSPTAPESDIPASTWPYLRVTGQSMLTEPDGVVWYDAHVLPVSPELAATPGARSGT
jgi:hypothetical protein